MVLGKKDKKRVASLNSIINSLKEQEKYQAVKFLKYLHDEMGITYTSIAKTLGVSQQHINNICLGKTKVKDETLYKMMSKLFINN